MYSFRTCKRVVLLARASSGQCASHGVTHEVARIVRASWRHMLTGSLHHGRLRIEWRGWVSEWWRDKSRAVALSCRQVRSRIPCVRFRTFRESMSNIEGRVKLGLGFPQSGTCLTLTAAGPGEDVLFRCSQGCGHLLKIAGMHAILATTRPCDESNAMPPIEGQL